VLNALKANPRTVDLRALAPHFYELAARVLDLFEEDEIVDILTEVSFSVAKMLF
jgi:GINS complex subunit 3